MIDQEKIKNYAESTIEDNEDRIKNTLCEAEKKLKLAHKHH